MPTFVWSDKEAGILHIVSRENVKTVQDAREELLDSLLGRPKAEHVVDYITNKEPFVSETLEEGLLYLNNVHGL